MINIKLLNACKALVEQFDAYIGGWAGEPWYTRIGLPMDLDNARQAIEEASRAFGQMLYDKQNALKDSVVDVLKHYDAITLRQNNPELDQAIEKVRSILDEVNKFNEGEV